MRGSAASIILTLKTSFSNFPFSSSLSPTFKRRLWNNERQRLSSHSTIKTNMIPVCQDISAAMSRCNSILDGYLASTDVEGSGGSGGGADGRMSEERGLSGGGCGLGFGTMLLNACSSFLSCNCGDGGGIK